MALREVKNKIRSIQKTSKVTKAMEAVSAVKMRKSQERALSGRPYAYAALTILKNLSGSFETSQHPLREVRDVRTTGFVVITSDKGLAGALNSSVLKRAQEKLREIGKQPSEVKVLAVGRKASDFFEKRGAEMIGSYHSLSDDLLEEEVSELSRILERRFSDRDIDECFIVYPAFTSTFEQEPVLQKILPLSLESLEETVQDIVPTKGKYAEEIFKKEPVAAYTIEPSPEEVLDTLIPRLLTILVYHAILELKASEHSARMIAMKNATDKAQELVKDLLLEFNKERQSLITREVSEIVGGIETLGTR